MIRIEVEVKDWGDSQIDVLCRSFESSYEEVTDSEKVAADKVSGAIKCAIKIAVEELGKVKEYHGDEIKKVRAD